MGNLQKIFSSFFRASSSSRLEAAGIVLLYFRVSLITRILPLRMYYRRYFQKSIDQSFDLIKYKKTINRIRKVLCNLPGKHSCLIECIVVHLYFKRRGIYVPLYLGVSKENGFKAHAWYDPENSTSFSQLEYKHNGKR